MLPESRSGMLPGTSDPGFGGGRGVSLGGMLGYKKDNQAEVDRDLDKRKETEEVHAARGQGKSDLGSRRELCEGRERDQTEGETL